jgi:recombination protein RecT
MKIANISELQAKAHLPAQQLGTGDLTKLFANHRKQIESVLPKHMTPERLLRVALEATKTPMIAQCSAESILGATIQGGILGLEPNTALGHAYLVPMKVKGTWHVQLMPGYQGLIELARRSGQLKRIEAHEVCANDTFDFNLGLEPNLEHKPAWNIERGDVVGFYAIAWLVDGTQFDVMSLNEIIQIRESSNAYKYGRGNSPWDTHFVAMGKKTVLKRLCKMLPQSTEFAQAVQLDEHLDIGADQNLERVLKGDYEVVPPTNEDYRAAAEQRQAEPVEQPQPPVITPEPAPAPVQQQTNVENPAAAEMQRIEAQLAEQGYYEAQGTFWRRIDATDPGSELEQFDPEIHVMRDGAPVILKNGHFRSRRGAAGQTGPVASASEAFELE